jgi:thymidylate synthase (FAD)
MSNNTYYQKVELVGLTQPIKYKPRFADFTSEDLIAYFGRVSNPKNQDNIDTAPRLINYLMREKHWSPFDMINAVIEIETTRDIGRQVLRHASNKFQEFSQRYADPTQEFEIDFVIREARLQDDKNRQNSIEVIDVDLQTQWREKQEHVIETAKEAYAWARSHNIAKEQARAVLPEGNTMSRLYVNGTIRSWLHYIDVRAHESTQKEHRELACYAAAELIPHFKFMKEWYEEILTR